MFASKVRTLLVVVALGTTAPSFAQQAKAPGQAAPQPKAAPAAAPQAKAAPAAAPQAKAAPTPAPEAAVPQTAPEHEARAKAYKEQAAQYRKAAEEHKQMAAAYAAKRPELKGVGKNPAVEKMSKHCLTLAKDFEKLATDSDKAADFHTMRAKELSGG
jgi:hypothetical protein